MNDAEWTVMSYLPEVMDVLARRHESARRFLWTAKEPGYWTAHRKWEGEAGAYADIVMAGAALKGLALTGTEEVRELLTAYRTRPDLVLRSSGLEGAVVDAAYIHRRVTEQGIQKVMDEVLYHAGDLTDFRAWSETAEGRDWDQWYVNLLRQQRQRRTDSSSPITP